GRQVRGRSLRGCVRDRADLRGDHGCSPEPDRARPGRAFGPGAGACGAAARDAFRGVDALMSELLALGISHKTAPVALRERLAFSEEQAGQFAGEATATPEVREAVVISTCNRTEVYLVVGDAVRAEADVLGLLARRAEIRPTELAEAFYSPRNCDAARQLYRVTAGLDSLMVGG